MKRSNIENENNKIIKDEMKAGDINNLQTKEKESKKVLKKDKLQQSSANFNTSKNKTKKRKKKSEIIKYEDINEKDGKLEKPNIIKIKIKKKKKVNKTKDNNDKIQKYRKNQKSPINLFTNFNILNENKLLGNDWKNFDYSKCMKHLNNINFLNNNINTSELMNFIEENKNRDFNEIFNMYNKILDLFKNKEIDFSDIDCNDVNNVFNKCQSIFSDIDIDFSIKDLFVALGAIAIFSLTFPAFAATTQCYAGFGFVSFLYNSVVHGIIPLTSAIIIIANSDILYKSASILVKSFNCGFTFFSNFNIQKIISKTYKHRKLFKQALDLVIKNKDIIPSLKKLPMIVSDNKESERRAKEKEAEMRRREAEIRRQKEEAERKIKEAERREREEEERRKKREEKRKRLIKELEQRKQREEEERRKRRRKRDEEERRRRQIDEDIRANICCSRCHSYNVKKISKGERVFFGIFTFITGGFGIGALFKYECNNCNYSW